MKILLIFISIGTAATLFWFCKTPDASTTAVTRQLRWGEGGGFTGKESMKALTDTGKLLSRDQTGDALTETDSVRKRKAKKLFALAQTLNLMKVDFKHPGNTYKFIEMMEGDVVHRITWGDGKTAVPAGIEDLFKLLNELK